MAALNFDSWALKRFGSDRQSTIQHYWPEIENAAQSIGASINGVSFIFDADFHKLIGTDNKRGKHSYTATIRQDGFPTITFQKIGCTSSRISCRDLAYQEWKRLKDQGLLDSKSISEAEAAAWRRDTETVTAENKASAEQQAKAREQEKRDKQAKAAKAAAREYSNARFLSLFGNEHPYLERKGITGTEAEAAGVKVSADGERLIIPIFDALTGEIITIQRIDRAGNKRLLSDGRKQGGLLRIGGNGKAWLCEGLATGFSVHRISGQPVIVCVDAPNIKTVAGLIDHADLLGVAADNDKSQAGEEAAKATGLAYRLPLFRSTKDKTKDWNDAEIDSGKAMALQQWAAYESQKPVFTVEGLWALLSPTSPPLPIVEKVASGTIANAEQEQEISEAMTPDQAAKAIFKRALKEARELDTLKPSHEIMLSLFGEYHALLHAETWQAIYAAITQKRAREAEKTTKAIKLTDKTIERHREKKLSFDAGLDAVLSDDPHGVILIRAPMGSGKTQRVGKPFAAYCKKKGLRFLALCHRQSLVKELATVLQTPHYQRLEDGEISTIESLASCLPSIVKVSHQQFYSGVEAVFIDEIQQVLRMMAGDKVNVPDGKKMSDVFTALQAIIAKAKILIGADAGLDDFTVRFIEQCRPKEKFTIYTMGNSPEPLGVQIGHCKDYNSESWVGAVQDAIKEIACGGRVWIGTETNSKARLIHKILSESFPDKHILCLHGHNKGDKAPKAFFNDPTGQSLLYDAVIHTNVISSGVSVIHDKPHFTKGYFFGNGSSITPADALQMLRRVRYLKQWVVMITDCQNNKDKINHKYTYLQGWQGAAALTGQAVQVASFDDYKASVMASEANAKADFLRGIEACLLHQGFSVNPFTGNGVEGAFTDASASLQEADIDAILKAFDIDEEDAKRLAAIDRTEHESNKLKRFHLKRLSGLDCKDKTAVEKIMRRLGVNSEESLLRKAIEAQNNRMWAQVKRFLAYQGKGTEPITEDESERYMSERRFTDSRIKACRVLFHGLDLLDPALRITKAMASVFIDRVIQNRMVLATLRLVPEKYGRITLEKADKQWRVRAYQKPKDVIKAMNEVLALYGVKLKRSENKHAGKDAIESLKQSEDLFLYGRTSPPLLIRENIASATINTPEQAKEWQALTWYSVDQKALLEVVAWSELKETAVSDVQLKIQKRKAVEASIERLVADALLVSIPEEIEEITSLPISPCRFDLISEKWQKKRNLWTLKMPHNQHQSLSLQWFKPYQ